MCQLCVCVICNNVSCHTHIDMHRQLTGGGGGGRGGDENGGGGGGYGGDGAPWW